MAGGIDELIDVLYGMVEDAWSVPLGKDRCVIEREKVLDILDEIRGNLPGEIKAARDLVEKRNDLIAAGKKDADAIRKDAEDKARMMVSENEVVAQANAQAEEIVARAQQQSHEIRNAANVYCEDMLRSMMETVDGTMGELRKLQAQFQAAVAPQQEQ